MTDLVPDAILIGGAASESSAASAVAGATGRETVLNGQASFTALNLGWRSRCSLAATAGFLLTLAACRTLPALPPVDTTQPGWQVRHGQAVWTAAQGERGVAGELLLANKSDGACFVQFAKPPFTLATARAEAGRWSVELMSARRRSGGHGSPPTQLVWFTLADAIREQPIGGDWRFEARGADGWCLTNAATGEALEGYFAP